MEDANAYNTKIPDHSILVMTKEYVHIFDKYLCNIYQMIQNKLFV